MTLSKMIHPSPSKNKAAALVEFIFITPLFVMFVLGMLQLALNYTVQSLLDHAVSKALTVAATTSGLDTTPNDCTTDATTAYCEAVDHIRNELKTAIQSSFINTSNDGSGFARVVFSETNPEISIPQPQAGETPLEALARSPITIRVNAEVSTIAPMLPQFQFRGIASGYREIRHGTSYPILTDCNGNPIGSSQYQQQPCDCSQFPNAIWNSATMTCESCINDRSATQDASHDWRDTTITPCFCPSEGLCRQRYGIGAQAWYAGDNRCNCGCNVSQGGFNGIVLTGQPGANSCSCGPAPSPYPAGNVPQQHTFSNRILDVPTETCRCNPAVTTQECQTWFPSLQVAVSNDRCSCYCTQTCPRNTLENGVFTDGATSYSWDPSRGCRCECYLKNGGTWQLDPNRTHGPQGCGCTNTCPNGQVPNQNDRNCRCECTATNCGPNAIQDPNSCACRCINSAETYPGCSQGSPGGG